MRAKLRCLLVALVLLPGCRSVKEFLFPEDRRSTGAGIQHTTNEQRRQEQYEDRQNSIMREKRKGRPESFPDEWPLPERIPVPEGPT